MSNNISIYTRILTIFILIITDNHSRAADYYINDNSTTGDVFGMAIGDNANNGLSAAQPKATLANLVTTYGAALANSTIYIDAGTYTGEDGYTSNLNNMTFIGAGSGLTIIDNQYAGTSTDFFMTINSDNITFQDMSFTGYENEGTQQGLESGQVFTINGGQNILFENVNFFLNGQLGGNAAINILSNSSVTLRGGGSVCNSFGTAYTGGIGVYGANTTVLIEDYVISGNYKTEFHGGGLTVEGGDNTTVTLNRCRISDNHALEGGAIYLRNGVLNVYDCVIENNETDASADIDPFDPFFTFYYYGSAVCIVAGTANFNDTEFTDNYGSSNVRGGAIGANTSSGGGFSLNRDIILNVDNCVFSGNTPTDRGSDVCINIAYGHNITATLTDCQFLDNGNYNLYNYDATMTATYFGTQPTKFGTVSRTLSANPMTTPSPSPPTFDGDCNNIILLPVELISFTGKCDATGNILQWSTASEKNNQEFILEKSIDNNNYYFIGTMPGAGDSESTINYQILDGASRNETSYYRLSQIDYDGKRTQFPPIAVQNNCEENQSTAYFDRNSSSIVLNTKLKNATVGLFDLSGKKITTTTKANSSDNIILDVPSSISSGVYLIHLFNESKTETFKVYVSF